MKTKNNISLYIIGFFISIYLITELLSVFNLINQATITLFWLVVLVAGLVVVKIRFRGYRLFFSNIKEKICNIFGELKSDPLFAIVVTIAALSVVIAISTTPYNHDSMTYHLARVAFWEQNHSIGHYATNVIRQIASPVFAEILCLHIYVLSGHIVNLCNLVQSFSYIAAAYLIYSVLNRLGVKRYISLISVIIYMTMPIAFAESVSTQNDLVVTVWFLMFINILTDFLSGKQPLNFDRASLLVVWELSSLVALSYLTKPSVMFGLVVLLFFSIPILVKRKEKIAVIMSFCFISLVNIAVLILPEMIRSIITFGSINSRNTSSNIMVGSIDVRYLFLNFLKNFTLNLPTRISPYVGMAIEAGLNKISEILGISLNDPVISFDGTYSVADPMVFHHDFAINPLIEYLAFFSVLILLLMFIKKKNDVIRIWMVISVAISFILFCIVLKYQPWGMRLMLPYLSALCIVVGIGMDEFFLHLNNSKVENSIISIILFLALSTGINCIMFQIRCSVKTFQGYRALYASSPELYEEDQEIVDKIAEMNYKKVGMAGTGVTYDFPFFVMMDGKIDKYYHVEVNNDTSKYSIGEAPDCIIWKRDIPADGSIIVNGSKYKIILTVGDSALFGKV